MWDTIHYMIKNGQFLLNVTFSAVVQYVGGFVLLPYGDVGCLLAMYG